MAFTDFLSSLRRFGRNIVLPVDGIKAICKNSLKGIPIETVLDFGSGTLFWSDWFIHEFKSAVYAVDTCYNTMAMPGKDNIMYYSGMDACLKEKTYFSLVWACDVLHHLSYSDCYSFQQEIVHKTDIIIIKDIDANNKLGNFMNVLHDRIINGEIVHKIYPDKLKDYFESEGFEKLSYSIPILF
ncbi:MAG: hypothetical protein LBD48_02415 [Treponema sp.]|jgi:hypothetical protein|nr:hypothetical protein [Treponema sp.]